MSHAARKIRRRVTAAASLYMLDHGRGLTAKLIKSRKEWLGGFQRPYFCVHQPIN
jgi:hypothetical protein